MSTDDTLERLQQATLLLCRDGSIKDRLAEAYTAHLAQLDLRNLPAEARIEFDAMRAAMNRALPLPRESVVRASVRKMSGGEASRHAELVVRTFATMAREQRPARARRNATRAAGSKAHVSPVASPGASPIVKLFAKES